MVAALEALSRGDVDAAMACCDNWVALELPFAVGDGLSTLYSGKPAVAERMKTSLDRDTGRFSLLTFLNVRVSELSPGDRVLAEYNSRGILRDTGAVYENQYVTLMTFKGDKIVHWCEYFNPLAMARASAGTG